MSNSRLYPLFEKITIGMFCYGFIRGMRSEYPEPFNVFGSRFCLSLANGIVYTVPPFNLIHIVDTLDRCDVYVTKKDPTKYDDRHRSIYSECFGYGKNRNVIL